MGNFLPAKGQISKKKSIHSHTLPHTEKDTQTHRDRHRHTHWESNAQRLTHAWTAPHIQKDRPTQRDKEIHTLKPIHPYLYTHKNSHNHHTQKNRPTTHPQIHKGTQTQTLSMYYWENVHWENIAGKMSTGTLSTGTLSGHRDRTEVESLITSLNPKKKSGPKTLKASQWAYGVA